MVDIEQRVAALEAKVNQSFDFDRFPTPPPEPYPMSQEMESPYQIDRYAWIDFEDALTAPVQKLCDDAYNEGWVMGAIHACEITDEERADLLRHFEVSVNAN